MKKFIYVSEFKVGPEATKKQTMLFHTDLAFAISEGYNYIQPVDGPVLKIISRDNLVEVDETEETEETLKEKSFNKPKEVEFDPTTEDSPIFKSNHSLDKDSKNFMIDVKICFDNGIKIIEDVDGFGFDIISPNILKGLYEPKLGSSLGAGAKSCINCESMNLIDGHINRILKQEHLSEHDVNVMLILATLSEHLGGH